MLGKPPEPDAPRDAVHVAIIPMTSTEQVWPGMKLNKDGEVDCHGEGDLDLLRKEIN